MMTSVTDMIVEDATYNGHFGRSIVGPIHIMKPVQNDELETLTRLRGRTDNTLQLLDLSAAVRRALTGLLIETKNLNGKKM